MRTVLCPKQRAGLRRSGVLLERQVVVSLGRALNTRLSNLDFTRKTVVSTRRCQHTEET